MKNTIQLLLLIAVFCLQAVPGFSGTWHSFSKTVEKEFPITSDGLIQLDNEWGKVTINTWNEDRVKVVVVFNIQTLGKSKGQKILDHLSVDFSNTASMVGAETVVKDPKKINWNNRHNVRVAINYEVFMPAGNKLKVTHHHGDVLIGELSGEVDIRLASGNLTGEILGNTAKLDLTNGKANIKEAGDIELKLKLSDFNAQKLGNVGLDIEHATVEIANAGMIDGNSKFGQYELGEIQSLSLLGHYDSIMIRSVDDLKMEALNAVVDVRQLNNSAEVNMELGKFRAAADGHFSRVDLQGKHTDFKLNVPADTGFQADLSARFGKVNLPEGIAMKRQVKTNVDQELMGFYGSNDVERLVKARISHGGISIELTAPSDVIK
jgi:hypothetical protein